MKRPVDIVVISDVHLGTYGCHANELTEYLESIAPRILVLNGDIVDIWQFRKRFFPSSHLNVLKTILALAASGTKVYYVTGNHDDLLRRFSDFHMNNVALVDKLVLNIEDKKAWFFHGDVFDASIQNARWLAKLGGWGYDVLILINRMINWGLKKMGREPYSISAAVKRGVKSAVKYIQDFEDVASDMAIENGYDFVICGHIHQPQMRIITKKKGVCTYLNSGDWVENLSALEHVNGKWTLFRYRSENDVNNVVDMTQILKKSGS